MAGNVTASIRNQTLFLTGDATANKIAVVATDNDRYAVIGIDTTVNRSENTYVTSRTIRNIQVTLNGGADVLLLTNDATAVADLMADSFELDLADLEIVTDDLQAAIDDVNPAEMFALPGTLTVYGGTGGDVIGVVGGVGGNVIAQLSDFGLDGANFLAIDGLDPPDAEFSIGGGLIVTGGSQADAVAVTNSQIRGRITADLGNGSNLLVVTASSVGTTLTYTGGSGSDTVATGDVTVGSSMAVVTRGGDDSVFTGIDTIGGTTVGRFLSIDTGSGADEVGVTGTIESSLVITTGDGNDEISIIEAIVEGNVTINSGAGADVVEATDVEVGRIFQAFLGLGDDQLIGTGWIINLGVNIDGGMGNDELTFEDLAVERFITLLLGSGDDTVSIATTTAMSLYVVGGAGDDTLTLDDATRDAIDDIFATSVEEPMDPPVDEEPLV